MPATRESPLQSKKFIAYLLADLGWKVLLWKMMLADTSEVTLLTTILVSGFIQVGYVLGQAGLDGFTHLADRLVDMRKPPGVSEPTPP